MRPARRTAVALALGATAALALAGTMVTGVPAAHAQPGPYSFVSVANSSYGMDEGSPWTAGTTFTPISPGGTSGYVELVGADGLCLTEVSATSITSKTCTGSAAQLWQSSHSPDFVWWNEAYDNAHHTQCPWGGAYTQAVIKGAPNGALTLACPDNVNGLQWPYGTDEEWTEAPPTSPSPSPSPSQSTTPPPPPVTVDCPQPAAPLAPAPDGVGNVGPLITDMTGAQLVAAYDAGQTFFDGTHTNADPPATDSAGDAVLTTNGSATDQAMISSCPFTSPGTAYLHGTFEARMDLPDAGTQDASGHELIAGWPAFWISGMNCRPDTPQPVATPTEPGCWADGGEFDVMESGPFSSYHQQADYHWPATPGCMLDSCVDTAPGPNSPAVGPGWHTFDGVWGPGYAAVYVDGTLEWSYTSSNVQSNVPLQVIFDMAGSGSGVSSTLLVQYLRVWAWQ